MNHNLSAEILSYVDSENQAGYNYFMMLVADGPSSLELELTPAFKERVPFLHYRVSLTLCLLQRTPS